jgi:hypothetical protein
MGVFVGEACGDAVSASVARRFCAEQPVLHRFAGRTRGQWIALSLLLCGSAGCASAGRAAAWEREEALPARGTDGDGEVERLLESAEREWKERDQESAVRAAISAWEAAVERAPGHTGALTRLARAHYFLVEAHLEESPLPADELREASREHHQKGADAAELALLQLEPEFARAMRDKEDFVEALQWLRPGSVEAAFWYFANLSRFALDKGFSTQLFYRERVAAGLERIRELDARFCAGGADRMLGAFFASLPALSGRDLERSRQHFRAAQVLGPTYLRTYVLEAETLATREGERRHYVELLQSVLAAPAGDDPDAAPENRAAQRAAQRLLAVDAVEARF